MKYIYVVSAIALGWFLMYESAQAKECTVENTGLKYTQIEGSFIASAMFLPFMVAMAPVVYPYDKTGQYECSVRVVAKDAVRFHKQKGG